MPKSNYTIMEYVVISFDSTHAAMATEKYIKSEVDIKVMPTPRAVSKACGISLRGNIEDLESIRQLLSKVDSDSFGLYIIEDDGRARAI